MDQASFALRLTRSAALPHDTEGGVRGLRQALPPTASPWPLGLFRRQARREMGPRWTAPSQPGGGCPGADDPFSLLPPTPSPAPFPRPVPGVAAHCTSKRLPLPRFDFCSLTAPPPSRHQRGFRTPVSGVEKLCLFLRAGLCEERSRLCAAHPSSLWRTNGVRGAADAWQRFASSGWPRASAVLWSPCSGVSILSLF